MDTVIDIKNIYSLSEKKVGALICVIPRVIRILGIRMQLGMYIEEIIRVWNAITVFSDGEAIIPRYTSQRVFGSYEKILAEIEREKHERIIVLVPNTSKKGRVYEIIRKEIIEPLKTRGVYDVIIVQCPI